MKYKFDDSAYAQLWIDNDVLRTYVTTNLEVINNYAWWKTRYTKADNPTFQQADGTRPFVVQCKNPVASFLPSLRADHSESIQGDSGSIARYSGSIPSFSAESYVEDSLQRDYKEKLYAQFGSDSTLIAQLTDTLIARIAGMHSGLSNIGAQLASTGKISYTLGQGIADEKLSQVPIPEANFLKAGKQAWSDTTAKLLDQMAKIELDFRLRTGYANPMTWHVSQNLFYNVILKNEQVKDWVKQYRQLNNMPYVDGLITEQLFQEAIALFPNLSPIVIEKEIQQSKTIAGVVSTVQGWKDGNAVLCPAGMFGEIAYSNIAEQQLFGRYGATGTIKLFSPLEQGIMTLINTTKDKGDYKEWKSEIIMDAIPTLVNFPYHLIVDTTVADD